MLNKSKSGFLSDIVSAAIENTLLSASFATLAAVSYFTKPPLDNWEVKLLLSKPGENGFNPNKFKCVPVKLTPAWARS